MVQIYKATAGSEKSCEILENGTLYICSYSFQHWLERQLPVSEGYHRFDYPNYLGLFRSFSLRLFYRQALLLHEFYCRELS